MAMKKVFAAYAVSLLVTAAWAQEEEASGETAEKAAAAESVKKVTARVAYMTLPAVRLAEGPAEVRLEGGDWKAVEEGRHYPLGASYRTLAGGRLTLAFGSDVEVSIADRASFGTGLPTEGNKSRKIVLSGGTVSVKLPDNLPEGAFFVVAPGFTVKNPAGESRYVYENRGDGDQVSVRCVTGALSVDGRHYRMPAMHAANEVVIRTSHDSLFTQLSGTSGDYVVLLDQGVRASDRVGDDGTVTKVSAKAEAEWHLTPSTRVVISRSVPAIGERMSVHTMAFDAAGERKSECSFCEGRAEVNSGELVPREKGAEEDLAKRAAEATEAAASDAEDTSTGEAKSESSSSDSEE